VVIEIGGNSKWAQLKRLSVLKVTGWHHVKAFGPKGGLGEYSTCCRSHEDRNATGNLISQSPVILVGVTDNHANEGRIVGAESSDLWKRDDLSSSGAERPSDIEHTAMTSRFDLDATTPDLVGTAVNANSHRADSLTLSRTSWVAVSGSGDILEPSDVEDDQTPCLQARRESDRSPVHPEVSLPASP